MYRNADHDASHLESEMVCVSGFSHFVKQWVIFQIWQGGGHAAMTLNWPLLPNTCTVIRQVWSLTHSAVRREADSNNRRLRVKVCWIVSVGCDIDCGFLNAIWSAGHRCVTSLRIDAECSSGVICIKILYPCMSKHWNRAMWTATQTFMPHWR